MKIGKAEVVHAEDGKLISEHYYDSEGNEISREAYMEERRKLADLQWDYNRYVDDVLSRGH
ncbi:hypothetical protein [Rhodococcus sp. 5G237]